MDNVSKFVAQIQANIRDFERGIKKAQASANSMPDEIETDVNANISKFRKGLLMAEAMAKRFSAKEIVKRIKIDPNTFRNMYHAFTANFTEPFNRRMGELATNIRTFGVILGNMIKGSLIASFSALVPIIAGATSAVMALGNAIGVLAGGLIGTAGALAIAGAGVAAYGGLMASVLARYNDEAFQATAASETFTRSLEGLKSSWSGIVDSHMDAIFNQMATALDAANFGLQAMTPFIDGVVASMGGLIDRLHTFITESSVMSDFFNNMNTTGVKVFDNIGNAALAFTEGLVASLNALMPLFDWIAQGLNELAEQFNSWAQTMAAENGFTQFINYVKENLPVIGEIFGNTFLGIIDLFAAFGANSSHVFDGLARMTERFREWAAALSENTAFQDFVTYIETHGPTVISLIGNIITTLVNFGIAIAPLASKVLELANSFFEWLSQLLKTTPIVGLIIGVLTTLFGIFQVLAPAIIAISTVLGPLISWFTRLLTNARLVSAIMTVLRGAMVLLSGPVGVVIGVLTALSAIFVMLYQNVEWFRNIVNTVWTWISSFISQQVSTIIGWFNHFREQGNNIFMSAMSAIAATILQGLATAWAHFSAWFTKVIVGIVAWGVNLYNTVVTWLTQFAAGIASGLAQAWINFTNWIAQTIAAIITFGINLVSTIVSAISRFAASIATGLATAYINVSTWISNTISAIISFVAQLVSNIVSGMAQFVSSIAAGVMNAYSRISTFVSNAISAIVRFVSNLVSNIISGMASFVSSIASGAASALSAITGFVSSAISSIISFVSNLVSSIVSGMASFVSSISSGAASALSSISSFVSSAISSIISFVSQLVSNIASGMASFVSEIISGGANAVSEVISMGSEMVSSVAGFVGDMISAGSDLIAGLVQGIKNKANDAVNAAKNVVGDAINGAKSLLGINSPSRVFRDIGQYTSQGLAIGVKRDADRAVSEVTRMASDMTDAYKPEFNNINADVDKDINGINGRIRNTVDADITSGVETQRPIVNVKVENQGDVEMIRSAIYKEDGIEDSLAF